MYFQRDTLSLVIQKLTALANLISFTILYYFFFGNIGTNQIQNLRYTQTFQLNSCIYILDYVKLKFRTSDI